MRVLLVFVVLFGLLAFALAADPSSSSSSSSSSSTSKSDGCQQMTPRWGSRYLKVLRQTRADLKHDIAAARKEYRLAVVDFPKMKASLRSGWKKRCSVACGKKAEWIRIRNARQQNLDYHQKHLANHKWAKKLQAQDAADQALRASYIARLGPVSGEQQFQADHGARLAAQNAARGQLVANGVQQLYDVHKGMVDDAQRQLDHAIAEVKKWKAHCKGCPKQGRAEFKDLVKSMDARHKSMRRHIRRAKARLEVVHSLVKAVKQKRADREAKYVSKHFMKCKPKGVHKYKCWLSPDSRPNQCFRFYKCQEHTWGKKEQRLTAVCRL